MAIKGFEAYFNVPSVDEGLRKGDEENEREKKTEERRKRKMIWKARTRMTTLMHA